MAGVKIVDLPALGRDLINTDLLEVSLNGGGSRKITGQEIMNASKLAIGSTPIVSGTVGRLLFQGTGNVLQQSGNLFWDNPNLRLGIGISTPLYTLDVAGNIHGNSIFAEYNIVSSAGNVWLGNGYAIGDYGTGNNRIEFYSNRLSFFGNGNEALRIVGSTGNLLVNTTTDAGFKLDVNGTARATSYTLGNYIINQASANQFIVSNPAGASGQLFLYGGTTSQANIQIYGSSGGNTNNILFNVGSTVRAVIFGSTGNVGINTTTDDGFRLDVNGTARVKGGNNNSLIIDNDGSQYTSALIRHNGNSRMQFTWDSSANSGYIGSFNTSATTLQLRAGIGSTFMILHGTGNVGIGTTTDAGFRLDVNGSARSTAFRLTDNTLIASAYTIGGTTLTISNGGHYNSIGINVSSATGIMAVSTIGIDSSGVTAASIYAAGGSTGGRISLGLLSNRALITSVASGMAMHTSSMLQVDSTTQGFLPPRMTNAQRAAIASPAVGLIVYCTDATEGLYVYKSTGWTFMV